jgi:hypothetical protein
MLSDRNNQKFKDLQSVKASIDGAKSFPDIYDCSVMINTFLNDYNLKLDSPEGVYLKKLLRIKRLILRTKKGE